MKATCHREGLLAACQLASVAASARDIKPILRNFKAIAENDRCTILATDLELGIRLDVRGVKVEKTGDAILPAARVTAILRESTDEELSLEADAERCTIRGQYNEFEMPGENPAEFPAVPPFDDAKYHEVAAGQLREMIRRTLFAASKENPRYAMNGVLWEIEKEKLRLVATDGRRLAVTEGPAVNQDEPPPLTQTHVVPTKAMNLLERNLQDDGEMIRLALRTNEALFKTDRATITTRLVEGRFPQYRDVFPKKQMVKIPLVVGPFYTAVRQAAIMTDDESKRVKFVFGKNKVTLQAQGGESGRSKVELPLEYDGKEIAINFDAHFLTDMLRVLQPDTAMVAELVDGSVPALFKVGTEYSYLVMPLT